MLQSPLNLRTRLARAAALLLLVPLASCLVGGDELPKGFEEAVIELDKGIAALEQGDYLEARDTLEPLIDETNDLGLALNFDPVKKDQARYSYVMADSLQQINEWINTVSVILGVAIDAGVFGAPGVVEKGKFNPAAFQAMGGNGLIAGALDSLLDGFSDFFAKNSEILQEIKKNPEFAITYQHLSLKFEALAIEIMDLAGEHDAAEVLFLDSVYLLANAIMKTILAVDFTISFNADDLPLGYLGESFQTAFEAENPAYLTLLSNTLAVVMQGQNKLLGLADGPTMKEAGVLYASSFANLGAAIETVIAEVDDQADDLVARVEKDDDVYLAINFEFGNVIVIDLDTLENLEFKITEDLQLALSNMEAAFAGEAGQRISWARDLVPVISVVAAALIRSGFVEVVIEAALSLAGEDPSAVGDLEGLLNSDLINENLIEGFLLGIFPDVIEFDVGYYFNDPRTGIRDWFPFWNLPLTAPVLDVDDEDFDSDISEIVGYEIRYADMHLFISFECDDEAAGGDTDPTNAPIADGSQNFLCFGNDNFVPIQLDHFTPEYFPEVTLDAFRIEHDIPLYSPLKPDKKAYENLWEMKDFGGSGASIDDLVPPTGNTEWGLLSDGVASPLGLVAFRDPTLGGMLWINLSNMGDVPDEMAAYDLGPSTFIPATNRSINALFQSLFGNIASLLNSF